MAKYIKELKYTDTATSTDYYVDTRAIKDADDTTKTLKQALDGKQATLPNASASGKVLKSTNTTGGVEWGEAGGLPSQSGQSGKFLTTNGTSASWGTVAVPVVVQTTGTSTTDVMSQNAVTEALGGKQASLPTTSTAGKVLKSTSTAGSVEWGDAAAGATWGSITGTLSAQTDLQSALDAKQATLTQAQQTAVDSGISPIKVEQYDEYRTSKANTVHTHAIADVTNLQATLDQCLKEGTPANITEKYYDAGSTGTINLANGHVQSCGSSTITLPSCPNEGTVTLTLYVTSTSVTWAGDIVWVGGNAPTLADVSVINFSSNPTTGKWSGSMVGAVQMGFPQTSDSGRTFMRNAANTGTIMTWNDSGTVRRTVVFDAAYRTNKPFYSDYETDLGLPTYRNIDNTVPSAPASGSDTVLSANNNFNQDTRGNTAATTAIIAKVGSDDCAANYVRGLTSLNASGCDLPTINCLCRIYNDRAILDSMDPTVSSYSSYSLVSWSFSGCNLAWSSSWYGNYGDGYFALFVYDGGYVNGNGQSYSCGVVPVLDLA